MVYSPQDVYARGLSSRRGYPLWTPEPSISLPDIYVRDGLKIGDVGVVVPEDGSFDVFFNVCLPPEHPLHQEDGVPDNFTPILLSRKDIAIFPEAESPGRFISTPSVVRVRDDDVSESVERRTQPGPLNYEFTLSSREGAVLIIPEGAERYYLRKEGLFEDEAIRHAVDWYNFAEQRLHRIISHDSLYLITGFHKARSWSLAAYQQGARTSEASAQFKALQVGGGNITASYSWETTHAMDWRVGPANLYYRETANQAIFIQGFKIAVREGILGKKRVRVRADPSTRPSRGVFSSTSWFSEVRTMIPRGSNDSTANTPKGKGTTDNDLPADKSDDIQEDVTVHRLPQMVKPFHPSDIINQYLLQEVPSATVAVTHDSQWITLLDRGLLKREEISQADRLVTAVTNNYSVIIAREDAVYLRSTNNSDHDTVTSSSEDLSHGQHDKAAFEDSENSMSGSQYTTSTQLDSTVQFTESPESRKIKPDIISPIDSRTREWMSSNLSGSETMSNSLVHCHTSFASPVHHNTVPPSIRDSSQALETQSYRRRPSAYSSPEYYGSSISTSGARALRLDLVSELSKDFARTAIAAQPQPTPSNAHVHHQKPSTNTQDVSRATRAQPYPRRPLVPPPTGQVAVTEGPARSEDVTMAAQPHPSRSNAHHQTMSTTIQDVSQAVKARQYSQRPLAPPASAGRILTHPIPSNVHQAMSTNIEDISRGTPQKSRVPPPASSGRIGIAGGYRSHTDIASASSVDFERVAMALQPQPIKSSARQMISTNTQDVFRVEKTHSQRPSAHSSLVAETYHGTRGLRPEPAERLTIAVQPHGNQRINVVLFGAPGVGKSAVVNAIARRGIARVSSGTSGRTLQSACYDIDDMNLSIFETVGLEESEIRGSDYLKALENAYEFVDKLSAVGGVHLLLFCIRASKLTPTIQNNYRLFSETVFQKKVPLAFVITGLEGEVEMEDWWTRNKTDFERYGLKSVGHACITTVTNHTPLQDHNYLESQRRIRRILESCCLRNPASFHGPRDWFLRLENGMRRFVDQYRQPSRADIETTLLGRLKLDHGTVQDILGMMEDEGTQSSGQNSAVRSEGAPQGVARRSSQGADGHLPNPSMMQRPRPSVMGSQRENAAESTSRRDNKPSRRGRTTEAGTGQYQYRHSDTTSKEGESRKRTPGETVTGGAVNIESRRANVPYPEKRRGVSMEDIRDTFPHDLTDHVVVDKYAFASGSYGDTYRGKFRMRGNSTDVAIKVYKRYLQGSENSPERIKQLHREITVWLKLNHPNVLKLFGTIRDPNLHPELPAVVCPWVENGSLTAYLEGNKSPAVKDRLILVDGVARGLQYLHSQDVIHGDLSSRNVLVRANGSACITDFGLSTLLATVVGSAASAATRRSNGTVRWMAPELLDPYKPSSPTTQSDVYSFGSIMLQTLTGYIPYHHLSRDEQVISAVMQGSRPKRPSQGAVTDRRWNFIEWCWSHEGRRPTSDRIVEFMGEELTGQF